MFATHKMHMNTMRDVRGILATVGSVAGSIAVWVNAIEQMVRISAGLATLAAAIYAARYWRNREMDRRAGKDSDGRSI